MPVDMLLLGLKMLLSRMLTLYVGKFQGVVVGAGGASTSAPSLPVGDQPSHQNHVGRLQGKEQSFVHIHSS